MKRDPGPMAALLAAGIVGVLYTQGGTFKAVAGLILLYVLITPNHTGTSMLKGLIQYVQSHLTGGMPNA